MSVNSIGADPWRSHYAHAADWAIDLPPLSLPDFFARAVVANRDRPLVDFLGRRFSYGMLEAEARSFAAGLQRLGLAKGAVVFRSLIVHLENGVPLQCEERYVNPRWAPEYLGVDFTQITPTQYLMQVAPFWEAQYSIEAARPSPEEAHLLRIERTDACLVVVRRTSARGVPITIARLPCRPRIRRSCRPNY